MNGTVDTAGALFDGYTCIDNKEKLYFSNRNSYVNTKFTLN